MLPWLLETGVQPEDLRLEQTFSLKVGRQSILIGGGATKERVGARLDILVRRGDRNLFVIEVKAPAETLTNDDRDQAIGYARLVHPVAPYAVVTNGKEWRLFNSLTKELVNPSELRVRGYEAAFPESLIAEAQQQFLGLNRANLARFCQQQVASEMRPVKGTVQEGKKYIPEIHVPRGDVRHVFATLNDQNLPGLLLVGESGSGKTSELCSIAESLIAKGESVLFFRGAALSSDIFEAIAFEFSWTFGGSNSPAQVVRRLESTIGNGILTIIVDAIDEWGSSARTHQVASLLRAAEHARIRVILSCKTSAVESFLSHRGDPTHVKLLTTCVTLQAMPSKEFFEAVERYRQAYGVYGGFEDTVLAQARENPFLLRVLFDVARDSGQTHITFSSRQFFEKYYERSLSKTSDPRRASEVLRTLAGELYDRNTDWMSEEAARTALGLRADDVLVEELIEYQLLQRTSTDEEPLIGFYFQQLRDYVIAFRAKRFNQMAEEIFRSELSAVNAGSLRSDVLTLYYRLAPNDRRALLDKEVRENAAKYLHRYSSLIQRHFPALAADLSPRTTGRIGFVGELVIPKFVVGLHGFRPIGDGADEVHFLPMQKAASDSNLAHLSGAAGMHLRTSSNGFRDGINIDAEVIDFELLPQIRDLIEAGQLNESHNPDLLLELVVETLPLHPDIFESLLELGSKRVAFPLDLRKVLACIQLEKLTRHFRDEIIDRKRRSGEIAEHWRGDTVSFSCARSAADDAEAHQKAAQALALGEVPKFRARYRELEDLAKQLTPAIQNLSRTFGDVLTATQPCGESFGRCVDIDAMDPERMKGYILEFHSKYLTNYKALVETNFPTLMSYFGKYAEPPRSCFFVLGPRTQPNSDWHLQIYSTESKTITDTAEFVGDVSRVTADGAVVYRIGQDSYKSVTWTSTRVGSFVGDGGRFGRMRLRSRVYRRLLKDLAAVEVEFRARELR